MKNISFFLTTPQFKARTKTVTRRLGWKTTKAGDVLMGVVKGQGIPKGGSVERLGPIRVKSARREILNDMGPGECALEGFPEMSPADFVIMFCANNGCTPETEVTRIEFGYLDYVSCLEEDLRDEMLGEVVHGMATVVGDTCAVNLPQPAEWFRKMQRRKGVFSNCAETLQLMRTGGDWVDIFFLKKWRIRTAQK